MPRKPNPLVKKAEKLYHRGLKLTEIATKLEVPASTVRRWKSEKGWDTERSEPEQKPSKKETNARNPRGAPKGNQNAVGNIGGGAPPRNHNNLRHGFYWDALSTEEQSMLEAREEPSEEERLLYEIHLWEVKERRLMIEIARCQQNANGVVLEEIVKGPQGTTTKAVSSFERIRALEGLLNSAQRGHLQCIRALMDLRQEQGSGGNDSLADLMATLDAVRSENFEQNEKDNEK